MWLTEILIYHGIYDNSNIHISVLNLFNSLRLALTNQLKLQAADGCLRFTDVMDTRQIMQLIMLCPSPKAVKFKTWIAGLAAGGKKAVKRAENTFKNAKDLIRSNIGNVIQTTVMEEIDIFNVREDEQIPSFAVQT